MFELVLDIGACFIDGLLSVAAPRLFGAHSPVIAASPDGAEDYDQVRYTRPALLMLGGERRGLTEEQRLMCEHIVRISMVEGMDSLNLAVAGSLLMYEVFRSSPGRGRR